MRQIFGRGVGGLSGEGRTFTFAVNSILMKCKNFTKISFFELPYMRQSHFVFKTLVLYNVLLKIYIMLAILLWNSADLKRIDIEQDIYNQNCRRTITEMYLSYVKLCSCTLIYGHRRKKEAIVSWVHYISSTFIPGINFTLDYHLVIAIHHIN